MKRLYFLLPIIFVFTHLDAQFPTIIGKKGSGIIANFEGNEDKFVLNYQVEKSALGLSLTNRQIDIRTDPNNMFMCIDPVSGKPAPTPLKITSKYRQWDFNTSLDNFFFNAFNSKFTPNYTVSMSIVKEDLQRIFTNRNCINQTQTRNYEYIKPIIKVSPKKFADNSNLTNTVIQTDWQSEFGIDVGLAEIRTDNNAYVTNATSISFFNGIIVNYFGNLAKRDFCVTESTVNIDGKETAVLNCSEYINGSPDQIAFNSILKLDITKRIGSPFRRGSSRSDDASVHMLYRLQMEYITSSSKDSFEPNLLFGFSLVTGSNRQVAASFLFDVRGLVESLGDRQNDVVQMSPLIATVGHAF